MRKLATIQEIKEILPIENADLIELVKILGWKCIVKKNEFKIGDRGVYFEVDSFLPMEEKYNFLKNSYRKNNFMGEGYRIKTMQLKGELSQGLFLPLVLFNEFDLENMETGKDVTELLGIKKWDVPEIENISGKIIGIKPFNIPTTNELRVQSYEILLEKIKGKPYYISTKMDGTSCSIYYNEGKLGVCGRNYEYKDTENCSMWKYVHKNNILEKMHKYNRNIVLQGEFCGEGIQKNRLRLKNPEYYIFDIIDLDKVKRLNYKDLIETTQTLGMKTVPIEEVGEKFEYNLEEILERAKGKYESGLDKEGIVVRPLIQEFVPDIHTKLSFKVLNNNFLIKEK